MPDIQGIHLKNSQIDPNIKLKNQVFYFLKIQGEVILSNRIRAY